MTSHAISVCVGLYYHDHKHVETTTLKCKKGLSVLKAMAAKDTEQRYFFLLYQSVVLGVIDYGPGLTTVALTNLLKLNIAERGKASHTGNHQRHTH